MKKSNMLLIALIVLIADVACMFLFSHSYHLAFWINLLFSVIAVVLSSFVTIYLATKEKRILGLSLTVYSLAYLVIALGISFRTLFLLDLLVKKVAFLHIVVLAVFLVIVILGRAENKFINEQQEIRGWEIMNFKKTLEAMKMAMSKMPYDAPYKKKVEHAYDSLASGQTATTPELEELEKSILDAVKELDGVMAEGKEETILQVCDKIERLAAERKSRLANKANF